MMGCHIFAASAAAAEDDKDTLAATLSADAEGCQPHYAVLPVAILPSLRRRRQASCAALIAAAGRQPMPIS